MPAFAAAVRLSARNQHRIGKAVPVAITLDEFDGDFMLLYACLWYATSRQVGVLVGPKGRRLLIAELK